MKALRFVSAWILIGSGASAALVSTNAGKVGEKILTSREVLMGHMLEAASAVNAKNPTLKISLKAGDVKAREFVRETTSALLETAMAMEAESFGANKASPAALEQNIKTLTRTLKAVPAWRKLDPDPQEVRVIVERKLRAKEFIKFKMDSASIPISDQEAQDYFNANRMKFENLPFENFKDTIKAFLTKQQSDKRLKDWFELLQAKYRVRNYLAE